MRITIDIEIVNHFREIVVEQLLDSVGLAATASSEEIADPPGIAVVIEFSGDLSGPIIWVFPTSLALELVRRLMADPDPSPELAVDGATELANILTGRASEIFEHYGVHCNFGVPRIHEGALPPGTVVKLATDAGCVDLMLAMLRQRVPLD